MKVKNLRDMTDREKLEFWEKTGQLGPEGIKKLEKYRKQDKDPLNLKFARWRSHQPLWKNNLIDIAIILKDLAAILIVGALIMGLIIGLLMFYLGKVMH